MTGTPLEYQSAEPRRPHSGAGIASLVMGALSIGGLCLSLMNSRSGTSSGPPLAVAWMIGLAFLACPVLGLALGIVALLSRDRRRVTAVVGVCLNGLVLLLLSAVVGLLFAVR